MDGTKRQRSNWGGVAAVMVAIVAAYEAAYLGVVVCPPPPVIVPEKNDSLPYEELNDPTWPTTNGYLQPRYSKNWRLARALTTFFAPAHWIDQHVRYRIWKVQPSTYALDSFQ